MRHDMARPFPTGRSAVEGVPSRPCTLSDNVARRLTASLQLDHSSERSEETEIWKPLGSWTRLPGRSCNPRYSQSFTTYYKPSGMNQTRIMEILHAAKKLAQEYRTLTGKPSASPARSPNNDVARILGIELTPARQAGYDAVEHQDGKTRYLQIKGRCLLPGCKPGQRVGSIDITKEWDAVLLVLLDENFEATEIYEGQL